MSDEPKPGTYGAITRSTEEEHKKFMKALKGLTFTLDEFTTEGPAVIFRKYNECMEKLK